MADKRPKSEVIEYNERLMELSQFEIKPDNPDALDLIKLRIDEFHQIAKEHEMIPLVEGLALCFGVQRGKVLEWANGKGGWTPEICKIFDAEISMLTSSLMSATTEGLMNPVSMIYMSKNNYGYRNDDREPMTIKVEIGRTPDQLIEESKNLQIK